MRFLMFSIFDTKTRIFLAPFPARSDIDAQRQLTADKDNPQLKATPIGQNPEDFELHCVSSFEDETGVMTPDVPRFIANIGDLFNPVPY